MDKECNESDSEGLSLAAVTRVASDAAIEDSCSFLMGPLGATEGSLNAWDGCSRVLGSSQIKALARHDSVGGICHGFSAQCMWARIGTWLALSSIDCFSPKFA